MDGPFKKLHSTWTWTLVFSSWSLNTSYPLQLLYKTISTISNKARLWCFHHDHGTEAIHCSYFIKRSYLFVPLQHFVRLCQEEGRKWLFIIHEDLMGHVLLSLVILMLWAGKKAAICWSIKWNSIFLRIFKNGFGSKTAKFAQKKEKKETAPSDLWGLFKMFILHFQMKYSFHFVSCFGWMRMRGK